MSTQVFVNPDISTQADGAQSSRVPVPLQEDPCEAIRQAYLVGTDIESKPFKYLVVTETPESPHIVAPPTCYVEESEGSGMSGARSTSSNSTVPLSPDHPLTHTTPALVPILRKTAHMAVRIPAAMSPGLSVGIAEVGTMSDSAFRKRVMSSYDSSPSPTLPVQKRYRGTSELILDTDSEEDEEIEESSDSDSESEDAEDEGPTVEDEDPTAGDEGLAREMRASVWESRVVRAIPVIRTAVSEPLGLGYEVLRHRELALEEDHDPPTLATWTDPKDSIVYIDVPTYPPPAPPAQTPPSPEWSSGSFFISPAPSIVRSPISSPMISLTVPSPIASPVATFTTTILDDEDQFIYVGAKLELYRSILQDHTQRLDAMPPILFTEIDRDTALQRELHEMGGRVTALEREMDHRRVILEFSMLSGKLAKNRQAAHTGTTVYLSVGI
nr:hypothetical protein [Tanacetum cinerariifolium]